jgi:putative peptidoglycan lipid II flippase
VSHVPPTAPVTHPARAPGTPPLSPAEPLSINPAQHPAPNTPDPSKPTPLPLPSHAQLSSAVRTVSGMTLLSRVGGLARDLVFVHIFGNTALGSAFLAGFAIPNMFRRLFGEGALSAAFIPEYTAAVKSAELNVLSAQEASAPPPHSALSTQHSALPSEAAQFASLTLALLAIVTGLLTAVIEIALLLVLWLAPRDADRALSIKLIMLMLPFMPLICSAAILGGMLQVHGRFAAASAGPVVLNSFIIATGVYCMVTGKQGGPMTAYALGAATVASGLTQAFWFSLVLRPHIRWTRDFQDTWPRARRMLTKFVPVLIGLGTLQVNAFVDTLVAMWPIWVGPTILGHKYPLYEDSNSIIALTQRLYQFPLGVFGIAVATAAFPLLARHADEPHHFASTLRRGLRLSLFIGLPATLGLMLIHHDITTVLFTGRKTGFDDNGVARSAAVLLGYAPGIWAYSLNHVFTRAFYAKGDTATPMRVAIAMVILNFTLNWTLIWPLGEAGLAWSTSIAAMVQCGVLALLCRRLLPEPLIDAETTRAGAKIILAAAIMAAAVFASQRALPIPATWTGHLISLGVACGTGAVAYLFASTALRLHELRWLLQRHH